MSRKKIALAMAGAGARAVMYFGILDVFQEHGIKIDMLAACSSATFVACAYASGTLPEMKKYILGMSFADLVGLFEPSFNGGVFSLERVEGQLQRFVQAQNLEDLEIPVAIVTSDIIHGEEVVFTMGSINRAIRASCSMPGLFEPVLWGDKVLLDGGLFNIIPVEAAHASGADIVIGIDLASTRNLFDRRILLLKKGYNFLTKPLNLTHRAAKLAYQKLFRPTAAARTINKLEMPGLLTVLSKAMDYALIERKKEEYFKCDIIIKPNVKGFGDIHIKKGEAMYLEGRRAALEALPEIKRLLL